MFWLGRRVVADKHFYDLLAEDRLIAIRVRAALDRVVEHQEARAEGIVVKGEPDAGLHGNAARPSV